MAGILHLGREVLNIQQRLSESGVGGSHAGQVGEAGEAPKGCSEAPGQTHTLNGWQPGVTCQAESLQVKPHTQ